jgi:EAL domain-containing protein (putative c-di-GMP-specific phosphodiesterase class I)/DNA-binding response OmpR family regulator
MPSGGSTRVSGNIDVSGSRIYIADDEAANRQLLEMTLARIGLTDVASFGDGAALLAAVERDEPDLILLDLRMPGLDGYQVLEALRVRRAHGTYVPILVLTADAHRDTRDRALAAGADDYLPKPFDAREVQLRAQNLLATRRLHRVLSDRNRELVARIEAVSSDLSRHEHAWAEVATALTQLEAGVSPEATAQAIADELMRISGLTSVFIVALDAGGQAVPLAVHGTPELRIGVNRPIPRELTERWRERVGSGPWVGTTETPISPSIAGHNRPDQAAMAVIPLRTTRSMLGALVALTTVADGESYLARRLPMLESFGAIATALLAPGIEERQRRDLLRGELESIIDQRAFHPVFQPIVDLGSGAVDGYEALTRFADGTRPDRRFADAIAIGLGLELEAVTLAAALESAPALLPGAWLSLNVSPELVLERRRLAHILARRDRQIVLEISEHTEIQEYEPILAAAHSLGGDLRFAVDDAGAGYASFRHILELRPDLVKLDIGLVRQIDGDDVRQALVAGIVYFAIKSGCRLVAEGVEHESERRTLRQLGVELGQGFLLGRPTDAATAGREIPPTGEAPARALRAQDRQSPAVRARAARRPALDATSGRRRSL